MLIFFILWIKNVSLDPQITYKKVSTNHVIHAFKHKKFIELFTGFKESI